MFTYDFKFTMFFTMFRFESLWIYGLYSKNTIFSYKKVSLPRFLLEPKSLNIVIVGYRAEELELFPLNVVLHIRKKIMQTLLF